MEPLYHSGSPAEWDIEEFIPHRGVRRCSYEHPVTKCVIYGDGVTVRFIRHYSYEVGIMTF